MSNINIAGERHKIKAPGYTLCGEHYPSHWKSTSHMGITCPKCWRILQREEDAQLAKARTPQPAPPGPDIPFDEEVG